MSNTILSKTKIYKKSDKYVGVEFRNEYGHIYRINNTHRENICPFDLKNNKLIKKYYRFRLFKKYRLFRKVAEHLNAPVILSVEAKCNGQLKPVPFAYLHNFKSNTNSYWNWMDADIIFNISVKSVFDLPQNYNTVEDMISDKYNFGYIANLQAEDQDGSLPLPFIHDECYIHWIEIPVCINYPAEQTSYGYFEGANRYETKVALSITVKRDSHMFTTLAANNAYWMCNSEYMQDLNKDNWDLSGGTVAININEAIKLFKDMIDTN